MQQSGFSDFITKSHKEKIIIGNSAGAVVLGKNIKSSNSEDIIGIINTEGLGLVEYSICPHYTNDKDKRLKNLSRELHQTVIGIPECSAIVIDGDSEKVVNDIRIFKP